MIDLIPSAFVYVMSDVFFWPSMAFTTMFGIFIGAVIYNGDLKQIKKGLFSLISYGALITSVNLTRIIPQIIDKEFGSALTASQPFASTATVIIVTIFYLFGMYLGVRLVKQAHKI